MTPLKKVDKTVALKKKNVKSIHFFSTPCDLKCHKVRIMTYSGTQIVQLAFSLTNVTLFVSISSYTNEMMQFDQNAAVILVGVDVDNWTDDKKDLSKVHSHHTKSFLATSNALVFIKCLYVTGENMKASMKKFWIHTRTLRKRKRRENCRCIHLRNNFFINKISFIFLLCDVEIIIA